VTTATLDDPPLYLPFSTRCDYPVEQRLHRLQHDRYGQGEADAAVFQFDRTRDRCLALKREIVATQPQRHVLRDDLPRDVETAVCAFIAEQFCVDPAPLDDLALRVQEDLAITVTDGPADRLAALHVCFPSGWAPQQKIGRSFMEVHRPVRSTVRFDQRSSAAFVRAMVHARPPRVRFIWSLQCGDTLNRHPLLPAAPFTPEHPNGYLRVERQTMTGFADLAAALFTIRTYLYPLDPILSDPPLRGDLQAAVAAVQRDPQRAAYKNWDRQLVGHILSAGA